MDSRITTENNKMVLRVTGSLNFPEYKEWRIVAEQFLDTNADVHILDLSGLDDVDSAGLGMMLAMKQWAQDRGRKLRMRFDHATLVGNMIQLAKFDGLFEQDTR